MFSRLPLGLVVALSLVGCQTGPGGDAGGADASAPGDDKVLSAAEDERPAAAPSAQRAKQAAAAAQRVDIPAGAFVAGSTPGDRGRDPVLEPALLAVELGAFQIDRALYPNDPAKPPLTGVPRKRANELCEAAGGRLCTELEWERACKGPAGDPYAGASAWDASCAATAAACASGFDVLGLGATVREWTASDVAPIEKMQPKAAAVRGARGDGVAWEHRCARRLAVDATASGDDLGFRCCYGAPNAANIPSPGWQQTYERAEVGLDELKGLVRGVPELTKYAENLAFFNEDGAKRTVLARADAGAPPDNVTLTTAPLLWSPVPGEMLLVFTAQSGKDALVAAFHRLPDGRHRVASTMVFEGEKGPIALGFNGYVRRRLSWATCWDCPAESGNVTYRDDNRVVITQK